MRRTSAPISWLIERLRRCWREVLFCFVISYLWVADPRQATFLWMDKEKLPKEICPEWHPDPALRGFGTPRLSQRVIFSGHTCVLDACREPEDHGCRDRHYKIANEELEFHSWVRHISISHATRLQVSAGGITSGGCPCSGRFCVMILGRKAMWMFWWSLNLAMNRLSQDCLSCKASCRLFLVSALLM